MRLMVNMNRHENTDIGWKAKLTTAIFDKEQFK